MNQNSKIYSAFFWKLLERFGIQCIQFVLQIILARLLDPAHYGMLAIMLIFTSLANVFVQQGFSTALIQNKDVTEEDYSSVFWVTFLVAVACYAVIFFGGPSIAGFYNMPSLVYPLRVLALMLFPGALNSVQLAKVSREMDFRKIFFSNIGGLIISGTVGFLVAFLGGGLWALVLQSMVNVTVSCLIMFATVRWKLRLICNWKRIKILFSYGWKILTSSLLNTFYDDIYSLVIGKKYSSETLGYYNRGIQFPSFIVNSIDVTVESVMLPAMSEKQDDRASLRKMMRESMMISAYAVLPMMVGLAAVAEPLVTLLLTEKWLPCVPYMELYCIACGIDPVHTCNLQAINAMGRSDIFLKLEVVKKIYFTIILVVIILYFDSPVAIAATAILDAVICWIINAFPNKKLLNYSVMDQIRDLFPSVMVAALMGIIVALVGRLNLSPLAMLILQIPTGVVVYLLLSWLFKPKPFLLLLEKIQQMRKA